MSYLIFKEIFQSRKTLLMYMVMGLAFAIVGITSGNTVMLSIPTLLIVYSVAARNEIYEDKNRGYDFLKTLPIKPYKIVVSKFITAFILSAVGCLYALVIIMLFGKEIALEQALSIALSSSGISLIFAGIFYVMVYKFGAVKAINIIRLVFISFTFVPFLITFAVKALFSKEDVKNFFQGLSNIRLDGYTILALIIFLYVILMLLSIKVFYKNR